MATIAPVVMSVVIWIVTQSIFALLFAFLGPLVAVGSLVDSRIQARRKQRRDHAQFERELDAARHQLVALHKLELSERDAATPSALRVVEEGARWSAVSRGATTIAVFLGRGRSESDVDFDAVPAARESGVSEHIVAGVEALRGAASHLDNAPLVAELRIPVAEALSVSHQTSTPHRATLSGIGLLGSGAVANSVARSLVVQLAAMLPPERFSLVTRCVGPGWEWLNHLPHQRVELKGEAPHVSIAFGVIGESRDTVHAVGVTIGKHLGEIPIDCEVVLDARGSLIGQILEHPDHYRRGSSVMWESVSEAQAASWSRSIAATAASEGRVRADSTLPSHVLLSELSPPDEASTTPNAPHTRFDPRVAPKMSHLACAFAVGESGPIAIDLVRDGPHAIVGGTTGSGKSELLISWVLALASHYSPTDVSVLLVDFKGGSSFGSLTELPHCVGLLTDLDEATARRALDSLAAEMRFRERALHAAGSRSIDDAPEVHKLSRLVIVVDEFAAMASEHPDLHALFSDIAARGRSLGVHLILCTQRPAGVIREAVFANSGLRISLRVNSVADSTAVINSDAAARLPSELIGRAVCVRSGGEPFALQCAIASPDDVRPIVSRFASWPRPRRPWLDPLPAHISLDALAARETNGPDSAPARRATSESHSSPASLSRSGSRSRLGHAAAVAVREDPTRLQFGVSDNPADQSQPLAYWQPSRDGHLLIIGQGRSGKSVAARTFQSVAGSGGCFEVAAPGTPEAVWDAVSHARDAVRSEDKVAPRIVVIDDLDAQLTRLGADHQAELMDKLVHVLREGPARDVYFVVTVQRVTSALQQAIALCGSTLILSLSSRNDHIMAGGAPLLYREHSGPGAGSWRGSLVQVAMGDHLEIATPVDVEEFTPENSFAVVSTSPRASMDRVRQWMTAAGRAFEIVELGEARAAPSLGGEPPAQSHELTPPEGRLSVSRGEVCRILIGDLEAWQSQWGALGQALSRGHVAFFACTPAEFRMLTRERTVPPPLQSTGEQFWLLAPGRSAVRARLATNQEETFISIVL